MLRDETQLLSSVPTLPVVHFNAEWADAFMRQLAYKGRFTGWHRAVAECEWIGAVAGGTCVPSLNAVGDQ